MQLLEVPFAEKDQAKALGARWNPAARKWYVPDALCDDLTPFARWLPQAPATSSRDVEDASIGLAQLLQQVEQQLAQNFPRSLWVKAEIAEMRVKNHAYLSLVESDTQGRALARAQGIIWQRQYPLLARRFEQETGSPLGVGQKVLLKVRVRFSPQYGFSLEIEDIDPGYTLGDIAAQLRKIREALIALQLYDRNRQLPLPTDYFRVAVLAPAGAAGLGDFQRDARQLQQHGLCEFQYFHAAFQGEQVESEFMAALDAIEAQHGHQPFDALIVIRGGGAQLDLHHLNKMTLAQRLAQMPMPVLTGIGHERDTTILDEIAALRLDTPSKVIAYVRDTIFARAQKAQTDWQTIQSMALRQIQKRRQFIEQAHQQVNHSARYRLQRIRQRLMAQRHQLLQHARVQLQNHGQRLHALRLTLQQAPRHHLLRSRERLKHLQHQLQTLPLQRVRHLRERLRRTMGLVLQAGPNKQLQRGFAMIKDAQGRPVTRAAQLKPRQTIQITFSDGRVTAKVEEP